MNPQNRYTLISTLAPEQRGLGNICTQYDHCNDPTVRFNGSGFLTCTVLQPANYGREEPRTRSSSHIFNVSWSDLKDFTWRLKLTSNMSGFHHLVFYYIVGVILMAALIHCGEYSLHYNYIEWNPTIVSGFATMILFCIGEHILFTMCPKSSRRRMEAIVFGIHKTFPNRFMGRTS